VPVDLNCGFCFVSQKEKWRGFCFRERRRFLRFGGTKHGFDALLLLPASSNLPNPSRSVTVTHEKITWRSPQERSCVVRARHACCAAAPRFCLVWSVSWSAGHVKHSRLSRFISIVALLFLCVRKTSAYISFLPQFYAASSACLICLPRAYSISLLLYSTVL
jgi:hypothetical protein